MNPPRRNPSDDAKYRQQYINNLRLQDSNNQLNLNANMIYFKTGQTPSPLPDPRTTTEKEADHERLKVEVRSKLKDIMDGANANNSVMSLSGSQLVFVANHIEEILKDLKPKYALGVPSPIFLNYIKALMEKESKTNSVDLGLQQSTGENILLSNQQITQEIIDKEDIDKLLLLIDNTPFNTEDIKSQINEIKEILPDKDEIQEAYELNRPSKGDISFGQELLNRGFQHMPTKYIWNTLLRRMQTAKNAHDMNAFKQEISKAFQLLKQGNEAFEDATQAKNALRGFRSVSEEDAPAGGSHKKSSPAKRNRKTLDTMTRPELLDTLEAKMNDKGQGKVNGLTIHEIRSLKQSNDGYLSVPKLRDEIKKLASTKEENITHGERMHGHGLVRKRVNPKVDQHNGIHATESYVPFGKYIIHRHKLSSCILMIRHKRGGAITTIPTTKITTNLAHIFRDIVNHKRPTYEQIGNLTKEEHFLLHNILTKSSLNDQLQVPSPSKTQDEQENDRFNILKGEISAGNDNTQMIKEFKNLLLKFMHEGKIPRRQGQEILLDLTSLGY
jgi:hypothetical protein